ncbi:immunoglobulin kappa light chain-like [Thunnus albacares]|uniref:immunoglobulin kappa light chain-like n=1 Tax=Thunnus albacares TaxID=8236 RepID=UPI001CF63BB7|nr:immunoglobulin kappa light chain-like [Thunnus albacares]
MTPPYFALFFTCLFVVNSAHMTSLKQPSIRFESANVGERVTLQCFCRDNIAVMLYWYKQTLGQKPKLVTTFYRHNKVNTFHDEFKDNPRFSLDTENNTHHLMISFLRISDSATYYCVSSNLYDFEFVEGTALNVKGSGLNIQALVHQSASESIQPVTLNCTVHTGTCDDGEHSVYWFQNSEESHPGIIYTHGGRNDQCERNNNTQTHTCVYNLPMKSLNLSHAGTYYCAVASCGQILFGNKTKLDFEHEVDLLPLVHFLSGALAFTTVLVVLLALTVCIMKRNCQCTDSTFSATSTPNAELGQDAENLHYAALRDHKAKRSRRQQDDHWSECVYSTVKQ